MNPYIISWSKTGDVSNCSAAGIVYCTNVMHGVSIDETGTACFINFTVCPIESESRTIPSIYCTRII